MMPYQLNPKPFIAEAVVDASDREYTPVTSIRELVNELGQNIKISAREMVGRHIKITIEGPDLVRELVLSNREFEQLRFALVDYNMTSNLTRVDLMDSDYARDVMKIEPVKTPLRSRSLTEDEALLYQEVAALLDRLRGPIFGTPTTERAADVIEKLQTALRTLADQKLSSEMDGHEYINAAFEEGYDSLIELARAASASDKAAVATTESCGCVFRDLNVPCRNPECKICHDLPVSKGAAITDEMVTLARKAADDALWKWRGLGERKDGEGLDGMHFIERVAMASKITPTDRPFVWWCNLNSESEALASAIPGAVELRGSDSDDSKERKITDFLSGKIRVLVTKSSIAGFGLNFQHCADCGFVGLNDSFEQVFQAVRRFWRFGQTKPVNAHFIAAETEGAVVANLKRKEADAERMAAAMVMHMADLSAQNVRGMVRDRPDYLPTQPVIIPDFVRSIREAA